MAAETSAVSSEEEMEGEEKILYDVLIPYEWPEMLSVLPVEEGHSLWRTIARLTRACWRIVAKSIRHPLSSLRRVPVPPSALVGLINSRLPWQLAISSHGQLLAVLREDELEIRSIEDNFESVSHSCQVAKDSRPQWRRVVWNRDNTMVAVGTSNGGVVVFSHAGKKVCSIQGASPSVEPGRRGRGVLVHACTGLAFLPLPKDDSEGCCLLAILHYGGMLNTYLLRHEGPPVYLHSFSLVSYHPSGVGSMVYHDGLNLLIVGSCGPTEGTNSCVSGWRMLDAFPYWAPMAGRGTQKKQRGFFEGVVPSNSGVVFRLTLSPSGALLASIDSQGQLCVWEVPSLRLHKSWTKEELPVSEDSRTFPAFGSTKTKKGVVVSFTGDIEYSKNKNLSQRGKKK